MASGVAITIGLNSVDPLHYGGWKGSLKACEADAHDMSSLAKNQGFEVKSLLTNDATSANVIREMQTTSEKLESGDIFMISYAGHGGQLPDKNDDELDGIDETWCLYDRQLVDDELYALFCDFAEGVRILVFSDSCHSGTVVKAAFYQSEMDIRVTNTDMNGTGYRFMPLNMVHDTYRINKALYDQILTKQELRNSERKVKASVILISGCQDNQLSADGPSNGLFTSQLLRVWNDGIFQGNYKEFRNEIVKRMPPKQTPNYFTVGNKNVEFEEQTPFTI